DRYPLAVVPERTRPSAALLAALDRYVAGGGTLLLTGPNVATEYADLAGVRPGGAPPAARPGGDPAAAAVFLPVGRKAVPVFGDWRPVIPAGGTEVWTYQLAQQEPERD